MAGGIYPALLMALLALPAIALAAWLARDRRPVPARMALHLAIAAIAMLLAALGLYLAAGEESWIRAIAITLLLLIQVLALSLFLSLRRLRKQIKPTP